MKLFSSCTKGNSSKRLLGFRHSDFSMMNTSLLLVLVCLPGILLYPYTVEEKVSSDQEEQEGNGVEMVYTASEYDDDSGPKNSSEEGTVEEEQVQKRGRKKQERRRKEEVHEADEYDADDTSEVDFIDANAKVAEKHGGVIKDEEHPGWHVSEGDIMFRECEEEELFGNTNMPNPKCRKHKLKSVAEDRSALIDAKTIWPLPIPYDTVGLGQKAKEAIREAFNDYKLKTCITFRDNTAADSQWIRFFYKRNSGCYSPVGRDELKSAHRISLDDYCWNKNTVTHEIMHALGFWHEQNRPDRDNYVTINMKNIDMTEDDKRVNFGKKLASDVTTYGFNYDYRSVMHYYSTQFGKKNKHGDVMETITPKISTELGTCKGCGLSRIDALQLNARYCNKPKDKIISTTFKAEIRRWMAIYNGDENADFRLKLFHHLRSIYPDFYFTVSSYDGIRGGGKHFVAGQCSFVWRHFGRNQVVCYTLKKGPRFPSESKSKKIMKKVVDQVKEKGCHAEFIVNTAEQLLPTFGYTFVAVHSVIHGNGLRSVWFGYTEFENFRCSKAGDARKEASLIVMFGD